MEFTELLQEIIRNNEEVTVYSIAKKIQCGRTWMQKVVSGDRKLTYDNIGPLCDYLKNYVSEDTVNYLYEIFAEEYFGARQYKMVRFVKERLERIEQLGEILEETAGTFSFEDFLKRKRVETSEAGVLLAMEHLIVEELARAESEGHEARIHVHFPSDWENMRDLLLYMLNDMQIKVPLDFKGILAVSTEMDQDIMQIENFLTSCEYAMYNLNIYNSISSHNTYDRISIFPYYVITENKVLLISEDKACCLEVEKESQIRNCQKIFEKKLKDCQPFVQELTPYMYTTTILPEIKKMEEIYVISSSLCTERYYTKEMIEAMIYEGYPNRDLAIATLCQFYESTRAGKTHMLFSLEALMNFVENEHTKPKKKEYQLNESQMLRLQLLKQSYLEYSAKPDFGIHVVEEQKYRMHKGFHLTLFSERMLNFVNYRHKGGALQNQMGIYISSTVTKTMRNFYDYLAASQVCMNRESTLDAMKVYIESVAGADFLKAEGEVLQDEKAIQIEATE